VGLFDARRIALAVDLQLLASVSLSDVPEADRPRQVETLLDQIAPKLRFGELTSQLASNYFSAVDLFPGLTADKSVARTERFLVMMHERRGRIRSADPTIVLGDSVLENLWEKNGERTDLGREPHMPTPWLASQDELDVLDRYIEAECRLFLAEETAFQRPSSNLAEPRFGDNIDVSLVSLHTEFLRHVKTLTLIRDHWAMGESHQFASTAKSQVLPPFSEERLQSLPRRLRNRIADTLFKEKEDPRVFSVLDAEPLGSSQISEYHRMMAGSPRATTLGLGGGTTSEPKIKKFADPTWRRKVSKSESEYLVRFTEDERNPLTPDQAQALLHALTAPSALEPPGAREPEPTGFWARVLRCVREAAEAGEKTPLKDIRP
jgi:hypothetical protein